MPKNLRVMPQVKLELTITCGKCLKMTEVFTLTATQPLNLAYMLDEIHDKARAKGWLLGKRPGAERCCYCTTVEDEINAVR